MEEKRLQYLRQGEIVLREVGSFENNLEEGAWGHLTRVENGVIREGEKSGHRHKVVDATLYSDSAGNLYIKAESAEALIEHPEHKNLRLNKKYYKVEIQREYDEAKHSHAVRD